MLNTPSSFFQNADLQIHLFKYLPLPDIIHNHLFISKEMQNFSFNAQAWSLLIERDFNMKVILPKTDNKEAFYLFYKAIYLEERFDIRIVDKHDDIKAAIMLFKQPMEALIAALDDNSLWKSYFKLSLALHQLYAPWLISAQIKNIKEEINRQFDKIITDMDSVVFERFCQLYAKHSNIFNEYIKGNQLKLVDKMFQSKNTSHLDRAVILYALYQNSCVAAVKTEYGRKGMTSCNYPSEDVLKAIFIIIKNKDKTFYPLLAKLLLNENIVAWQVTPSLNYAATITAIYNKLKILTESTLTLNDFLIDLYTDLAKAFQPFRNILIPPLGQKEVLQIGNTAFHVAYHNYLEEVNIRTLIKGNPALFSDVVLLQVKERLAAIPKTITQLHVATKQVKPQPSSVAKVIDNRKSPSQAEASNAREELIKDVLKRLEEVRLEVNSGLRK